MQARYGPFAGLRWNLQGRESAGNEGWARVSRLCGFNWSSWSTGKNTQLSVLKGLARQA
jgi:hypothetical protein